MELLVNGFSMHGNKVILTGELYLVLGAVSVTVLESERRYSNSSSSHPCIFPIREHQVPS
jgi:hypothetical protein